MTQHVFISHASADKDAAYALCHLLEGKHGVRCWIAPDDIPRGTNFAEAIVEAIRDSIVFLLLFSKETNDSMYVEREVRTAADAGTTIIPFRLDDEKMNDTIAFFLGHHQWIEAQADMPRGADEVADAVQALGGTATPRDRVRAAVIVPSKRKRRRGPWIAALAVLLIGGGVATWVLTRKPPHHGALQESKAAAGRRDWETAGQALDRARAEGASDSVPAWLEDGVAAWRRPPQVAIQKPADKATTQATSIKIWGTVTDLREGDKVHVVVNDQEVESFDADTPAFERTVPLPTVGEYVIAIRVQSGSDIRAQTERTVSRGLAVPEGCAISSEQTARASKDRLDVFFENKLGMWFVLIPAGKRAIGPAPDDVQADRDEVAREVEFPGPLYVQVGEVTNAQFRRFKPAHDSGSLGTVPLNKTVSLNKDEHPAVRVSREDAVQFAAWLTRLDSKRTYRLPTEAEWEYAARTTDDTYGDAVRGALGTYANFADKQTAAAFPQWLVDEASGDNIVGPAARDDLRANPWGLRNMLGNVEEWCSDFYGTPTVGLHLAPIGPAAGEMYVVRGGSWASERSEVRLSNRFWLPENIRDPFVGFRLVVSPKR